ncbi:triacylglycerol lipase [Necator americanus]|uniref:Triacylglycerol lipase n=1 Tax=Necator americanus TaxID=51031 RepID=W2SYY9_NECAM|nr:triacylglycerol lipase [Necator americanus]ETN74910.1 triacylglycerol lipase [Necator americanus]
MLSHRVKLDLFGVNNCEVSQFQREINVRCGNHRCSGFTAVLHNHTAIVVSFRGTTHVLHLIEESFKVVVEKNVEWPYGGMVSKYFRDAFMDIWSSGMELDVKLLRAKFPNYEVWLTGHSLGGALASLAAHWIVGSKIIDGSKIKLVTLGQPRIGDKMFARNHSAAIDYSFRIVHWRDVIPQLPLYDERPGGYYHQNTEIFYKKKMSPTNYIVCKEHEDQKCSRGLCLPTSFLDHLYYFGRELREGGKGGCPK